MKSYNKLVNCGNAKLERKRLPGKLSEIETFKDINSDVSILSAVL